MELNVIICGKGYTALRKIGGEFIAWDGLECQYDGELIARFADVEAASDFADFCGHDVVGTIVDDIPKNYRDRCDEDIGQRKDKADLWDEGYRAGVNETHAAQRHDGNSEFSLTPNPYRERDDG